ncbi:site-specific integrase [Isoptericola sp. b490]|uniref:tyrosine-type recombinase/integrase n=1 Tax=Actinotalea lenta TaxID=3064654 RepID=UPI0027142A6B|nr:site-specific integrase [Isoptericola sp. b490]MDO8122559.1 site-specific integrase [Isoptericola sp. b490]
MSKRPNGKWRARFRDAAGKEHARHFARKADADQWLAAQTTAVVRGDWVDPALSRVTVAEWSKVWLATKAQLRPKTIEKYESSLRIWVLPRWGDVPLNKITHADLVKWVAEIQEGRSPQHTRHTLLVMSQMLRLAVRDGRLTRNVADGVPKPRAARPVQRFLSHKEVAALAREMPAPYDILVVLLAFTGLRFGEAAALHVGDVDLDRARLTVNWSVTELRGGVLYRDAPKTYRRRTVPIPAFLATRLAELVAGRPDDASVFSGSKGGPLRNSNFRHYFFDPAVRRAGLEPLTPHNLRDTAASLAVASGASVKVVQRMLGHASAAMTLDVYSGLFDAELDDVADRMGADASEAMREWRPGGDDRPSGQ